MKQKNTNGLVAFIVGLIFSLGLGLSGMTNPKNVLGFLDIFGDWNPSLIFVMIGAISVHFILFRFIMKREAPLLSHKWHVPTKHEITPSLILGSSLFGIGWGLAGYCPGPALVSLANLNEKPFIFVISMSIGMLIFQELDKHFKFKK